MQERLVGEFIDRTDYIEGLAHLEDGTNGKAQYFPVDLFRDWIALSVPGLVRLLLMRRYRVMDQCLYFLGEKIFLQEISLLVPDHEEMPDMTGGIYHQRQHGAGMVYLT